MFPIPGLVSLASASIRRVAGGIGGVGGSWPGSTHAYSGSFRHSAWPAGDAAGFTGSMYQVPAGGGFCLSSCCACAYDLSMSYEVGGFGPHSLTICWLPVCPSPMGSHRQGGGGIVTGLLVPADQFPLNWTSFSSETEQVEPPQPVPGGGPLPAPAGPAIARGSASPVTITNTARRRRIMACSPWPAGSKRRHSCRSPASYQSGSWQECRYSGNSDHQRASGPESPSRC